MTKATKYKIGRIISNIFAFFFYTCIPALLVTSWASRCEKLPESVLNIIMAIVTVYFTLFTIIMTIQLFRVTDAVNRVFLEDEVEEEEKKNG